jgi:beta-lysine 5,6-aminomutase alpha subunit
MLHLPLEPQQIQRVKTLAREIAAQVQDFIDLHSSDSSERTVLRLYGVDGVTEDGVPLPNRLVELLRESRLIESGVSRAFAAAMIKTGLGASETAQALHEGTIRFSELKSIPADLVINKEKELCQRAISLLDRSRKVKREKAQKFGNPSYPWRYLIVASGNIFEDRTQARSAAFSGADVIAVIRSTAQSLLDYIPFGATTEGFGGTYATQENFRIMRSALDEVSQDLKRYVRLTNYSSGLCMAEIAACAAIEDLDMLLNDSMYGILFRDINMKRTFVDQYFSRMICGRAKIVINTGEDNYLTTSDAIDKAYTVTASQLINEAMGHNALLSDDLLGLGHAFEINPKIKNQLLYEVSHAQLARQLFPSAPLKYMPATKHKSTDIFFSHVMDTLFNLVTIATKQGIHLAGMATEAIHTPLMQDRYKSLANTNYVFNAAADFGSEFQIRPDGFIAKRAQQVLDEAEACLIKVHEVGLMQAISEGQFADTYRSKDGGKGLSGVFAKAIDYSNPILAQIKAEGMME